MFFYFYYTDFLPFKWKAPLNIVRQSWTVICLGTVCQSCFPEMWFAYNSGEEKSDLRGMDHLSLCFLQAEIILQLIDFCHCFLSPHRGNLFIRQTTILHASMIGLWSLLFSSKHWVTESEFCKPGETARIVPWKDAVLKWVPALYGYHNRFTHLMAAHRYYHCCTKLSCLFKNQKEGISTVVTL